jgi:hypothetical protein
MSARPRQRTLVFVACGGVLAGLALAPADRPPPGPVEPASSLVRAAEPGVAFGAPAEPGTAPGAARPSPRPGR